MVCVLPQAGSIVVNLVCSSLAATLESDATHQRKLRKLRQKQLQQQFREQMETRRQSHAPAEEVAAKHAAVLPAPPKHSTPVTAASELLQEKVVFPGNTSVKLLYCVLFGRYRIHISLGCHVACCGLIPPCNTRQVLLYQ